MHAPTYFAQPCWKQPLVQDGIYILSAALVQEEYLLRWKQLSRVVALVRLSVGQFLLPMLPVGLTSQDAEQIDDLIMTRQRSNNRASASLSEGDVMGLTKELSGRLTPKEDRIGVYATLKNIFSAKQTLIEALLDMALKEDMHDKENNKAAVDARDQPELRDFQESWLDLPESGDGLKTFRLIRKGTCTEIHGSQREVK